MEPIYKAIFFDFDDTLGKREAYAYDCWRAILKENTNIQDEIYFEAVLQDCMIWDQHGNADKEYLKQMLKKTYGIELPYPNMNAYWDSVQWNYVLPQDDAKETLEILNKKYKLGIITNGDSTCQRNKILGSGLSSYFDMNKVIVSGEYGYHKPDKRLFLQACKNLDVKPEESVYVGDIFARDILGAYSVGMKPIWIYTHGIRKCSVDVTIIHKLGDLLEIL